MYKLCIKITLLLVAIHSFLISGFLKMMLKIIVAFGLRVCSRFLLVYSVGYAGNRRIQHCEYAEGRVKITEYGAYIDRDEIG